MFDDGLLWLTIVFKSSSNHLQQMLKYLTFSILSSFFGHSQKCARDGQRIQSAVKTAPCQAVVIFIFSIALAIDSVQSL